MSNFLRVIVNQQMRLIPQIRIVANCSTKSNDEKPLEKKPKAEKPLSPRIIEFQKKLRETTPLQQLEELEGSHPHQEKQPLKPWPNNTNPHTGERGGPAGPEPTRYGDWERKGRVSDF